MNSIFSNQSSRVYCISGNLHDIFCARDLQIMHYDKILDRYLRALRYQHVYFYSYSDQILSSYGRDDEQYISNKNTENKGVEYQSKHRSSVSKVETENDTENVSEEKDNQYLFSKNLKPNQFMIWADKTMICKENRIAIIVTNFSDLLEFEKVRKQEAQNRSQVSRGMLTYLDKWKDLDSSNDNIIIFMEKNLDFSTLIQKLLSEQEWGMASLFMDNIGSNNPTPKKNSCLFVSNPRYDEIENLLEYLRIVGFDYSTNDSESVTLNISFDHVDEKYTGRIELARAISYYSRECERKELKMIKEALENGMIENYEMNHSKVLTLDVMKIKELYSDCHNVFEQKTGDELEEELKNTKGWENAAKVVSNALEGIEGMKAMHETNIIDSTDRDDVKKLIVERMETKLFSDVRIEDEIPNFVLQGPPGVGKTEIANIIGRILNAHGILRSGHTVVASRDMLVGQWVGSSAINTARIIEQAQEGVLLIDEVYSLAEDNENNSYCKEVIDTLVAAMTNKENHICFIFSGYQSRMDTVWKMNEGLYDRFGEDSIITIDEYDEELINTIFCNSIEKDGFVFADEVNEGLSTFFENFYADRDRDNYANARTILNLASSVKHIAVARNRRENKNKPYEIIKEDFAKRSVLFNKRGRNKEQIFSELVKYPGLEFLKDLFINIQAIKMEYEDKKEIWLKENEKKELPKELEYPGPMHMIWVGNPGTGKSTAAKMIAELYHELGIFGGKEPVYIDAGSIKGKYIGSAEDNINKIMDEAKRKNTVLVIEEAYQLIDENYGKAALNAMLNRMEDERKQFNVIFVLYKSECSRFLDMNPGLESRMLKVEFNDYDTEQLSVIFDKMLRDSYDDITEDAKTLVYKIIKDNEAESGNARKIRKMIESLRQVRFSRIWDEEKGCFNMNIKPKDRYAFTMEDVLCLSKKMEVQNGND